MKPLKYDRTLARQLLLDAAIGSVIVGFLVWVMLTWLTALPVPV